jgi:hypothetical protein
MVATPISRIATIKRGTNLLVRAVVLFDVAQTIFANTTAAPARLKHNKIGHPNGAKRGMEERV